MHSTVSKYSYYDLTSVYQYLSEVYEELYATAGHMGHNPKLALADVYRGFYMVVRLISAGRFEADYEWRLGDDTAAYEFVRALETECNAVIMDIYGWNRNLSNIRWCPMDDPSIVLFTDEVGYEKLGQPAFPYWYYH